MSAFGPELMGALGAFITAAPGSEDHQLDGSAPSGTGASAEQLQPVSAGGLATKYADAADGATQQGRAGGQAYGNAAVGQLGKAEAAGKKAIEAEAGQEHALAGAQKSTFDDALANIGKFDEHFAKTMGDVRQKTTQAYDQYLSVTEDYKNTHVYNWWSKASTGAAITGLISQFLAGGLQGLTGQLGAPTPLDKVIEHDLQLQRMDIAQKGEIAGQARGLYMDLKGQFKDEIVAEGAMRDIAYNSVIKKLDAIAGGMGGQAVKAKAEKEKQLLTQKIAQNRADLLVHLANVSQNGAMSQAGVYENLAGLWNNKADSEAKAAAAGKGVLPSVSGIAGSEYLDVTERDKLGKQKTAAKSLLDATSRLQTLIGNKGKMDLSEYVNEKDQIIQEMVLQKKNVDDLGAISKADMAIVEGAIGAGGGFTDAFWRTVGADSDKEQLKRLAKFYIATKAGWNKNVGSHSVTDKATGRQFRLHDTEGVDADGGAK